jgi:hypothetical protein
MEFDVWSDAYGKLCATEVSSALVYDNDAPYGYIRHEIRIAATSKREAVKLARIEAKAA